jgi:hypothetical protein
MAQAKTLVTLPPAQQEIALQNLQLQSPDLADLVRQYLSTLTPPTGAGGGGGGQGNTGSMVAGVDTRPAPEQRPARRAGG